MEQQITKDDLTEHDRHGLNDEQIERLVECINHSDVETNEYYDWTFLVEDIRASNENYIMNGGENYF